MENEPGAEILKDDETTARANALKDYALCDRCLGRFFAKKFRGVAHSHIGSKLRELTGSELTEESDCYLCHGLFSAIDQIAGLPVEELGRWEFDTLWVGSRLEFGQSQRENELLSKGEFPDAEGLKVEVNREIGKRLSSLTGKEGKMTHPDMLVVIDTAFRVFQLEPAPLFIYGRYRKLVRGIPQTKWPCRKCHGKGCSYCDFKGKMYETSVEELIAPVLMDRCDAEQHYFHGMGREDIDAVMLGSGRPFIMELTKPHRRSIDLVMAASDINQKNMGSVSVAELRFSSREEVRELKAASPVKRYRITFRCLSKINKQLLSEVVSRLSGAKLSQRTPQRVSHRRADLFRERTVLACTLVEVDGQKATLEIEAESGTYIKEFITGDAGRTVPSVSEMLGETCEVVSLDVSEVNTGAGEKW